MAQARDGATTGRSIEALWRAGIWILLIAALFLRGKVLYVMLYASVATYFLSRYIANRSFAALQFTRDLSAERAFVGERIDVTVSVTNPSRLPVVWLLVSDEVTHLVNVVSPRPPCCPWALVRERAGRTAWWRAGAACTSSVRSIWKPATPSASHTCAARRRCRAV